MTSEYCFTNKRAQSPQVACRQKISPGIAAVRLRTIGPTATDEDSNQSTLECSADGLKEPRKTQLIRMETLRWSDVEKNDTGKQPETASPS